MHAHAGVSATSYSSVAPRASGSIDLHQILVSARRTLLMASSHGIERTHAFSRRSRVALPAAAWVAGCPTGSLGNTAFSATLPSTSVSGIPTPRSIIRWLHPPTRDGGATPAHTECAPTHISPDDRSGENLALPGINHSLLLRRRA